MSSHHETQYEIILDPIEYLESNLARYKAAAGSSRILAEICNPGVKEITAFMLEFSKLSKTAQRAITKLSHPEKRAQFPSQVYKCL